MAQFKRISRQDAIDYLNTSANWQELRRNNRRIKAAEDLSTTTLRDYANGLRKYEATGRWATSLEPFRRHEISENLGKRGRKPGFENYQRPEKVPRMFWEEMRFSGMDRTGRRVRAEARFTVTAGETVAVRALKLAAKEGYSVQLVLTGPLTGQQAELFRKGGYDAKLLLMAAGYRPTRRGGWVRNKDKLTGKFTGPGIEKWLINYIAGLPRYKAPDDKWPFISLYQIYAREQINEVDEVAVGHQRTYYLPLGERMTAFRRPRP